MAALGMDMAIVPAIAVGSSDVATDECPLGQFRSFYYQSGLKCVLSETPYDAGLLSKATAAFASRNIGSHVRAIMVSKGSRQKSRGTFCTWRLLTTRPSSCLPSRWTS